MTVTETKAEYEKVTQRVLREFEHFQEQKVIDMRDIVLHFVTKQVSYFIHSFILSNHLLNHVFIYLSLLPTPRIKIVRLTTSAIPALCGRNNCH